MNSSPQKAKTITEVVAKIRNKLVVQSNLSMRNREDIFKTDKYGNIKTENKDTNLAYQYGIADVKDKLKEFLSDKKKEVDKLYRQNKAGGFDLYKYLIISKFIDELWGAELK